MVPASLVPTREQIQPLYDELVGPYVDYCTTVSTRSMAMSIESCTYLWHLCRYADAERVCDLGSGFTSYTLGVYARTAGHPVEVVSVDTDPVWLNRTKAFCEANGVRGNRFQTWEEWKRETEPFDVIVHDIGAGDLRNEAMIAAARRTGRLILFDDMGHKGHSAQMLAVCDTFRLNPVNVAELTLDQVNRFARLAVR